MNIKSIIKEELVKFLQNVSEGSIKKGSIVIAKKGVHKGDKHEVIHDFGDGTYNIRPMSFRNKYHLGAAGAKANELELVKESTPSRVQKAQSELIKTIEALKKNYPMYKAAKESGDKSKLEKHRKIALKLTKAKKELEKKMDSELKGLYSDAELQLEKGKGLWANIHAKRKRGEKAAKKGDKDYPDEKAWKDTKKASEGKLNEDVYDNILKAVPDNYSYKNLALDVANIIKNEYGSHNIKPFMREIGRALKEGKVKESISRSKPKLGKKVKNIRDIKPGVDYTIYNPTDFGGKIWITGVHIDKIGSGMGAYTFYHTKENKMAIMMDKKQVQDYIKNGKVFLAEGKLNEDVFKSFLGDDPAFKLYTATNTDKRKSVMARKTDKTWDDGVPVLKYIARASKKDSPLPKGKFKIIEDNKHGWWYYLNGSTWYGIQQKDYGTPPFEY